MLVITRKPGESILIGDDIRIVVCSRTSKNTFRLGIEAPGRSIKRGELVERIERGETKERSDES